METPPSKTATWMERGFEDRRRHGRILRVMGYGHFWDGNFEGCTGDRLQAEKLEAGKGTVSSLG